MVGKVKPKAVIKEEKNKETMILNPWVKQGAATYSTPLHNVLLKTLYISKVTWMCMTMVKSFTKAFIGIYNGTETE
jgi:hypothetical protein